MMNKPDRIPYEELIKTITMFWIDRELEETVSKEVQNVVDLLSTKLTKIDTKEGLREYISSDKDSLENILSLMEISEEKFKRIISMLRREKKHVFTTEWSLEKTRSMLIDNESLMDSVCDLLLNGSSSERFKRKIPDFYRESFKIDSSTMSRLTDRNELIRLAKSRIDVKYNSSVANIISRKVEDAVKLTCDLEGLTYVKNKQITTFDKSYMFTIPDVNNPKIVIDCSYNITTSSTQSKYAEKVKDTRKQIKEQQRNTIIVNVIEGAGWIGRQSDFRTIFDNSDYTLNLANIGLLDQIIRYGMED